MTNRCLLCIVRLVAAQIRFVGFFAHFDAQRINLLPCDENQKWLGRPPNAPVTSLVLRGSVCYNQLSISLLSFIL